MEGAAEPWEEGVAASGTSLARPPPLVAVGRLAAVEEGWVYGEKVTVNADGHIRGRGPPNL